VRSTAHPARAPRRTSCRAQRIVPARVRPSSPLCGRPQRGTTYRPRARRPHTSDRADRTRPSHRAAIALTNASSARNAAAWRRSSSPSEPAASASTAAAPSPKADHGERGSPAAMLRAPSVRARPRRIPRRPCTRRSLRVARVRASTTRTSRRAFRFRPRAAARVRPAPQGRDRRAGDRASCLRPLREFRGQFAQGCGGTAFDRDMRARRRDAVRAAARAARRASDVVRHGRSTRNPRRRRGRAVPRGRRDRSDARRGVCVRARRCVRRGMRETGGLYQYTVKLWPDRERCR